MNIFQYQFFILLIFCSLSPFETRGFLLLLQKIFQKTFKLFCAIQNNTYICLNDNN